MIIALFNIANPFVFNNTVIDKIYEKWPCILLFWRKIVKVS